jgi:serine phosphatase RsbU (regulator of sigma subunit)
MSEIDKPWYLRASTRWNHFRSVPFRRLWVLLLAVFLLFAVIGFHLDLDTRHGTLPYAAALALAVASGLNAVLWIVVVARMSRLFLILMILLQFFNGRLNNLLMNWMTARFHLQPLPVDAGIHFASSSIMACVIFSYLFFTAYIRREGRESFRMHNELELAHGIQKTLVPPVSLRAARFEVYGVSFPSDKVGGDLVDALFLSNGDAIAYLADIAGHGLQAGILMGMLKTATRTALLDAGERAPDRTLPQLLDRLNTILPEVKEPHMYATFTGFRLGVDGSVYYALAASPPILHWHAAERRSSLSEQPQLPLGLLPVPSFSGETLNAAAGDLIVVATDGILEVTGKQTSSKVRSGALEDEYGVERVQEVIAANAQIELPILAERILASARAFGKQLDDQTILMIRCL